MMRILHLSRDLLQNFTEILRSAGFILETVKELVKDCTKEEYSPKVLIADAANVITLGFSAAFNTELTRLYCWAHVINNLDKIKKTDVRKSIRNGVKDGNILFAQSPKCRHGPPVVLHGFGFSEVLKKGMLEIAKV